METRYGKTIWHFSHTQLNFPGLEEHKKPDALSKGRPQLKKSQKFQLLAKILLDPLPPSSKKSPTDKNVGISYLVVIIKLVFFEISNPPFFHQKAEPHRFLQLWWPLKHSIVGVEIQVPYDP